MRETLKVSLRLFIITLLAGLALGVTYGITKDPIAEQAEKEVVAARQAVLPAANEFIPITEYDPSQQPPEGLDSTFVGTASGEIVGFIGQVTVSGYGGEIEVIVGLDCKGQIIGINVGGPNFAETVGLGANAKNPEFTDQFAGLTPPLVLNEDVDAITSATITSRAVTDGVNLACSALNEIIALYGGAA